MPATNRANAGAALARRAENGVEPAAATLADYIRDMEAQFKLAMPRGMEASQLVRDALTALRMTPKLAECERASVLGSLMTCAQLGLRPGVLGHAWLLPFWDRKLRGHKAQLVLGYQGLAELAYRSGRVASVIARTVYANEEFDVDYGLSDKLVHKPNLFADRGDPIAYYAIVKLVNGGHAFYVLSHRDAQVYRDEHATARTREGKVFGPWVDHFEAMAQKTAFRQLAKWMPKSTELAVALAVDEGVRVDVSPTLDAVEATEHLEAIEAGPGDQPEQAATAEGSGPTAEEIAEWNAESQS